MGFGPDGWYKPVIDGQEASRFYSRQDKYEDTTLYGPLCVPREKRPKLSEEDQKAVDACVAAFMKIEEKRHRRETMLEWLIVGGTVLVLSAVMLFLAYKGLEYCGCFDNIREIKQQIDKAKTTNAERTAFFEWRSR